MGAKRVMPHAFRRSIRTATATTGRMDPDPHTSPSGTGAQCLRSGVALGLRCFLVAGIGILSARGLAAAGETGGLPPTISSVPDQVTPEDTPLEITFAVDDPDEDPASLTVSAASSDQTVVTDAGMVVTGDATRRLTIAPVADVNGTVTITVTVSDGTTSVTETFVLTVTAVNDAPTAVDDVHTMVEDQTGIAFGSLGWNVEYVVDTSQTVLGQAQSCGPRDNRGLAVDPTGQYLYAGYNNGCAGVLPQIRKIDLTQPDPTSATVARLDNYRGKSIAVDDAGRVYVTALTGTSIDVFDADLTTLQFRIATTNAEGVDVLRESGTLVVYASDRTTATVTRWELAESAGAITGATRAGLDGDGQVTVAGAASLRGLAVAPDGSIWVADLTGNTVVRLTPAGAVAGTTSVPGAIDIAFDGTRALVAQSTQRTLAVLDLNGNVETTIPVPWRDVSLDEDGNSGGGALSGIAMRPGGGFYVANETGRTADFKSLYGLVDAKSGTVGNVFYRDITRDDTDPILHAASSVRANDSDADGDPLTVTLVSDVSHGSLTLDADGSFSYVPDPNFAGTDTFTYTLTDGALVSNVATATLTVTGTADPPTVSDISDRSTPEDTPAVATFTIGDPDVAPDALAVQVTSSNQALVPAADLSLTGTGATRTLTMTPAANAAGSSTITVSVSDGSATATDTFVLTVTPVSDAPTVSGVANLSISEDSVPGPVFFTVNDADTPAGDLVVAVSSNDQSLVPSANLVTAGVGANRSLTITPLPNAAGTATITIEVSDGTLVSTDTFLLTVTPVNDAPSVGNIADQVILEGQSTGALAFQVGDIESPNALAVTVAVADPVLVPSGQIVVAGVGAARTLALTPAAGRSGVTTVTVTVTDPDGGAAERQFTLEVRSCRPTLDPTAARMDAHAWSAELTVQIEPGCAWSAATDVPWIQLTSPADGSGSGRVTYTLVANTEPVSRTGAIVVRGERFVVAQGSSSDEDADTLPDGWEHQWGLDAAAGDGVSGADGDPDDDGATNAEEYAAGTHPRGFFSRHLSEGAAGGFFETRFALLNPGARPALALLRFLLTDGTSVSQQLRIESGTRTTFDPASVAGLVTGEFSTIVESDELLVVDRTMAWGSGYGAHAETALPEPGSSWYLAEGATHSGFDLFYLVENPHAATVPVTVRYLRPAPLAPITKQYDVGPNRRLTIWVDREGDELANTDVSAVISAPDATPIIVERAMYLTGHGQRTFEAGHASAAIAAPATTWYLAEGATGPYFDLFVLIANPSAADADVDAHFLLPDGTIVTKQYSVAANSRFNIWVDGADQRLADTATSARLVSTNGVPIVVERAMWWPGGPETWEEAHASGGLTETGTTWALAEGEVGGPRNARTFLLVANTSLVDGAVDVTLTYEDGGTETKRFAVVAHSRLNIDVAAEFPSTGNRRFGSIVDSVGAPPAQIAVERAMYWSDGQGPRFLPYWPAGTDAVATKLR